MGLKNLRGRRKNYKKSAVGKVSKSNGLKAKKTVINPLLKSYVKQIVRRNEETKFFTGSVAYKQSILGSGFNTTSNFGFNSSFSIVPTIQQGVGQQQRIGNRITTPGYITLRGHVIALPTSTTSNPYNNIPFYVKIVVWRQRQSLTTVSNTAILDNGISAGGNDFDGTLDDMMVPFNYDRFEIAATRTFVLQPNATIGTYSAENLSKYPMHKFLKMRVKVPKTLMYNDNSNDPTNSRWYVSAGIANFNGDLAINTIARAQITLDCTMKYTDA